MKVVIAGGGLAGLALGYNLRNSDVNFEILEKEPFVGGLLKSEKKNGYTFDAGGSHILFSKDEDILKEMVNLVGQVVMHRRRTFIFYRNRFIKYPFENGIFMLPPEERFEILRNFVRNICTKKKKPKNLHEFFRYMFGSEIVEKYLGPYNKKIWKRDLDEISIGWTNDRIPNPPVDDVLRAAVGIETEGYAHQLRFFYPLNGGIESLVRGVADTIRKQIYTSTPVQKINPLDDRVVVNGKEYDYLISTIPMPVLGHIMGGIIEELTRKLDYNSVTVVGLGVRAALPDFHWVYVPQKDIIFHRVAFLSNYSPNMAPPGRGNIIAEISHRAGDRPDNPVEKVIEGIEKMGIHVEIETARVWENRYAYVVSNESYLATVSKLRELLKNMHILPLGRHGNWEYINMDAVWARSREIGRKLRGLK